MLAFYGKKTNPRASLLLDQAITASKAIANIPTWMGYFATWRVKCISTSEAGEILVGCKRIEKESLRWARWELQQWFSTLQVDSTLSATAQPFQPRVAPQSSWEDDVSRSSPVRRWPGAVPLQVLPLTLPWEGHFLVITNTLMMTGYPPIPPPQIVPPVEGMGARGAAVTGAAATPMALAPLGEGVRKRMDFQVRSRFLSSEARKAILMMWPVPSGSGLTASRTIVISMRIRTSCPW